MIKKLTNHVLEYLISSNVIENDDESKDYYQYGIEITISSLLNIVLIVAIGIVSGNILESILFLSCFVPLRQFTGGFHAKTYFLCNLSFSISSCSRCGFAMALMDIMHLCAFDMSIFFLWVVIRFCS
ncbi:MAG: accessory gene regulator B family protein [Clostridium sp.]|nr:accessory gene regulator B family protein [Clostridium sp.]